NQELENANVARVQELVEATRPRIAEEDLRGFEWYYFWKSAHSEVFRLAEPNRIANVKFVGDGGVIAIAEASHAMFKGSREYLIRLYDWREREDISSFTAPAGDHFDLVAFSPDLKYVATDSPDNSVSLWDIRSGNKIRSFPGNGTAVSTLLFAPARPYL